MVQAFGLLTFSLTAASLAVSAAGVWLSIRLANRIGVLDVPNERSSHVAPTPRMGGVPMVAATVIMFVCWALLAAEDRSLHPWLSYSIVFSVGMAILGFWDDLSSLSPQFRFLIQFVCASLVLWLAAGLFPVLAIGGWTIPRTIWILTGATWTVWLLNLYNFMDGIDGIAGGEAAVASCFFFLVFSYHGETGWAVTNLFVAAASMGFLVHNWPPARVFMGDAGSAFLGAFFGIQSVVASLSTPVPFPVLVLPFANFILDTTATLIRRVWQGEKWYQAHRSHFFQRMTNLGMSHAKVTVVELISVVLSCAAAAWYLRSGSPGRVASVVAVMVGFLATGVWISRCEKELMP